MKKMTFNYNFLDEETLDTIATVNGDAELCELYKWLMKNKTWVYFENADKHGVIVDMETTPDITNDGMSLMVSFSMKDMIGHD